MTRILLNVVVLFALFQGAALALGSDRGQAGVVVGVLVVVAVLVVERLTSSRSLASSAQAIGLGRPQTIGVAVAAGISFAQLMVIPVFAQVGDVSVSLVPGGLWLLPGLFMQGGIAEEVLFRGYLFGHLRRQRSFWRAVSLSMIPFVAVHLILFMTMSWSVALAALALSVVMSVPFAHLYELGGSTIWAPALLHAVIQGTAKVTVVSGGAGKWFPFMWMATGAALSLLALVVPRPSTVGRQPETSRRGAG